MKIIRVTPVFADRFLFVEVETDTGLVGVGESGAWGQYEASAAAVTKFAEYLRGRDPRQTELHWQTMQRYGYFQGAAIGGAISAIDIALWDIKAQALGVPVHALLGGPTRTSARAYAHVKAATVEQMVALALRRRDQGFTAIGHVNPFLDEDRGTAYFSTHDRKISDAVDVVSRLREALGRDVDLCLEIHRRLTPPEAIALAAEIAPFRPLFYEDPIAPTTPESMAQLAAAIALPVATGERFHAIHQFQSHLRQNALGVARVSVCLIGGITGAMKVAAIAEGFDIQIAPHNPLSPVSLAACLQVAAAIPNFLIQEYPLGCGPKGARDQDDDLRGAHLVDALPAVADGFITIPDRPGIGLALSEAARNGGSEPRRVRLRSHRDGFLVDQ